MFNKTLSLSVFFFLLSSSIALARINPKDDSRIAEERIPSHIKKHQVSVAAMIAKKWFIKTEIPNKYLLTYKNLRSEKKFCEGERYNKDPSVSKCAGTLLPGGKILTAAHCLGESNPSRGCSDYFWVFDYQDKKFKEKLSFPRVPNKFYAKKLLEDGVDLFKCKKVTKWRFSKNIIDLAVIELEKVPKRASLKIDDRREGVARHQVALGFPNGVPLKGNLANFFFEKGDVAYNEMYSPIGSSGSPLFDAENGDFVGIILSSTYKYESKNKCNVETLGESARALTLYQKRSAISKLLQ